MAQKLFVGGLPFSVNDNELEEMFAQYGSVASAKVITDRETGRSKGFGFVEFQEDDDAKKAVQELDGSEVGGRKIAVNEARPREEKPRGGNGGGFNRNSSFRR